MASKLMRTPVGPEPTIFGLVLRRLAHQAKEALNAIRPPKALNATSAVWVSGVGLIGSSKASDPAPPPPPRRPRAPPLRATATATSSEEGDVTPVGFEPTQLALVERESTPLKPLGQSVVIAGITYIPP